MHSVGPSIRPSTTIMSKLCFCCTCDSCECETLQLIVLGIPFTYTFVVVLLVLLYVLVKMFLVLLVPYVCFIFLVKFSNWVATWENSCSLGLQCFNGISTWLLICFSHLGFLSGNLFLIAPFPDRCLLVPFSLFLSLAYPFKHAPWPDDDLYFTVHWLCKCFHPSQFFSLANQSQIL